MNTERVFRVPLLDGYEDKDMTGEYKEFYIHDTKWNSIENPPMENGEYLLAVWDGFSMNYDVCFYNNKKWEVTNDWYEGKPIAYVAWTYIHTIIPVLTTK